MKKGRHKIIHVIAIIILVLILVRVFTLSFNGKVGQAKSSMKDVIISGICSGILESSSIIRYQTDKERVKTAFPLNMASGINNIYKNIDTGSKSLIAYIFTRRRNKVKFILIILREILTLLAMKMVY